ncbi:hypothetical protein RFI_27345 [Reticulomyxa filosa]|uniref:Uncharacterized protein n=1 Tax=Reticulomyxa filosa TaxID=46433 RepID=X6M8Q0_RETFI|nr:hypothetical protein RFI_27345 [Reticulomyxa filosa]|eukprot:ETO10031.1 hypothetical protein RFI_27345 [Reticulomyxa filosa]
MEILKSVPRSRKCWYSKDGILTEMTVDEVLPVLHNNIISLQKAIDDNVKEVEMKRKAFKKSKDIKQFVLTKHVVHFLKICFMFKIYDNAILSSLFLSPCQLSQSLITQLVFLYKFWNYFGKKGVKRNIFCVLKMSIFKFFYDMAHMKNLFKRSYYLLKLKKKIVND